MFVIYGKPWISHNELSFMLSAYLISLFQIQFIFDYLAVFVFPGISFKVPDTEVNIFRRTRGYSEISHDGRGNRFIQCNEERTYPQCRLSWLWLCFIWHAWQVGELSSVALSSFFPAFTSPSAQNRRNIDKKRLRYLGILRGMCPNWWLWWS